MTWLKGLANLIVDDQPKMSGRSPATVAATAVGLLVAVLVIGGLVTLILSIRLPAGMLAREGPPNGIRVKVQPRTFAVETRQPFTIQAAEDFDESCSRVQATISDQQWEQTFTRTELLKGVRSEWNPTRTGTYRMQFFCRDNLLGETNVSVVIPKPVITRMKPKQVRWVLKNGKPLYRDGSFFVVPVTLSAEVESKRASFVPRIVDHDTQFRLLDQNGQITNLDPLVVQRSSAISEPVYVPFPIGADYRLIAYEKDNGQASNELKISWKDLAPSLSLAAWPENIELYSAGLSSSSVSLYLLYDARRIKPSETTDVLVNAPSVFKSDPANAVPLSPTQPIGTYHLSAPTTSGKWKINFNAPQLGIGAFTNVTVVFPWGLIIAAMALGLVGVVVARNKDLFAQKPLAIILEIVTAVAAAVLLYALLLTGWIPLPLNPEFVLSYLGAIVIGMVGGFSGLAVFQLAKRVLLRVSD